MRCVIALGFKKTAAALFSNKCTEDFISQQEHVEVLVEQSSSRKSPDGPQRTICCQPTLDASLASEQIQKHLNIPLNFLQPSKTILLRDVL